MHLPWSTFDHLAEGMWPAHQTMGEGYDYEAIDSVRRLPPDAIPAFEPNFRTIEIHGQAKLVDVLSSAPIRTVGYLISERLRDILTTFNLPLHRLYQVPVTYRGRSIDGYWWLHLPHPSLDLTDCKSASEVEELITRRQEIANLDMVRFHTPVRFAYCFVSRRLREAIEANKITGVRFGTAKLFRTIPK